MSNTSAALISYSTGLNTTRPVQDKLSEIVSVKDFGAKGDGSTDDSAAFQAAVNASDRVRVPAATYVVSTTPTWGSKSVYWDIDPSAVITGNTTFPFMATNREIPAVGPYIQSQSTVVAPNTAATAAFAVEALQPSTVNGGVIGIFAGTSLTNSGNESIATAANLLATAQSGSSGNIWGLEVDVGMYAPTGTGTQFGISLNGDGTGNPTFAIKADRADSSKWQYGVDLRNCISGLYIENTAGLTNGIIVGSIPVHYTNMAIMAGQIANGGDNLFLQRFTDTAPTGYLINSVNAANTAQLFSVDALGNVIAAGTISGEYLATGTGAVARQLTAKLGEHVSVKDFGAKGDNATDDLAAFNAATAYCQTAQKKLVIPRGSYLLSGAWTITAPIDIDMDASANLRWSNATSAGIVLDLRAASVEYGLCSINLGGLYSPAVSSSFAFPGYPSSWSTSSRSTQDAVTLMGGSRIDVNVHYALGWNSTFHVEAAYDSTNGATAPQNVNLVCNTSDLCLYGVWFDAGPSNAGSMGAIDVTFNTCFAKYPIFYGAANAPIRQCNARITGQAFTEEAGGAIVYGTGANIATCRVDVAWAYAGYSSYDSPSGTSTSLSLPFVAGSLASNGSTTDGNSTLGYFGGSNNRINIGMAVDQSGKPGGALPASGLVTRIRDAGSDNQIDVDYYSHSQGSPIALPTTQGEANFAGGVGSASVSRKIYVSLAVPTMANSSENTFYCYSSLLSAAQGKPIQVVPQSSSIGNSKMNFTALDNSASVNREIQVQVTNLSGASVTGATYYAWLVVG